MMHLAGELLPPADAPCLDVGAGTGRNTFPLARRGYPVDAVELSPALAAILERDANKEELPVRVHRGNILSDAVALHSSHYRLVVAAEVTSHFRGAEDLRRFYVRLADILSEGGLALVQVFVPAENVLPDEVTRQLSQTFWSTLFTYGELREAARNLPLRLESDESVVDYERMHTPPPPSGPPRRGTRAGRRRTICSGTTARRHR